MTERKRYTLSLSRWHAIADRISAQADARAREAQGSLGNTTVSFTLEDEQIATLRKRGAESLEKMALALSGFEAVGHIRAALAKANAEQGVAGLLATQAALRRQQKLLREVGETDVALRTSLDSVNARLAQQQSTGGQPARMYGSSGIPVAIVDQAAVNQAKEQSVALESRLAVMSDQINDLNKHAIDIELPLALAREAGLEG